MKINLLLIVLLFNGCVKITFREYIYTYKIEAQSTRVSTLFRMGNGKMLVDTITKPLTNTFNSWEIGWGSENVNDKYYIKVKNDTTYGYIKVSVLRNNYVIKQDIRRDSIILTNL